MYPYDENETETGAHEKQHALQRLVEDPLYWRETDTEFRAYVDNGFKSIYGNEEVERDATGRTIDPAPRPVALPPFKPSIAEDDLNLAGGVGENQANRWRDVWKVQKGLSSTGHYALDSPKRKAASTRRHSPRRSATFSARSASRSTARCSLAAPRLRASARACLARIWPRRGRVMATHRSCLLPGGRKTCWFGCSARCLPRQAHHRRRKRDHLNNRLRQMKAVWLRCKRRIPICRRVHGLIVRPRTGAWKGWSPTT